MVYVLIPAHNNQQDVLVLLLCLERQREVDLQVVLVDDGSTDGTEDEVRRQFPRVMLLNGNGNLWWTGANVLGVSHIMPLTQDGDFILLLNNDLTVSEDYVSWLVTCSERRGRAIVGSTTVDDDHREKMVGGLRLDQRLRVIENTDTSIIEQTEYDDQVDVLSGRGTLIPIEVFRAIGTFDQWRLPHYGADYEFSIRAKRAGFALAVSHRALVYAKLSKTGFYPTDQPKLSMSECRQLLFSRKSTANLGYYLTYVWICSNHGRKLRNTLSHGAGLLMSTLGKTTVGSPFATILKFCLKSARSIRAL